MNIERKYENFLEFRRQEKSNFLWISKRWEPTIAFKQGNGRPTPYSHKEAVLNSPKIQELLFQISTRENVPKSTLETQVRSILNEIGYEKKLKVIRWLGLVLTKICLKVLTGIHVNVDQVQKIKNGMGSCPVIFVPTHRSYGDFIMMSYVTFNYDVELPAIVAGMDFHGMWGMGTLLRDTGAFFMRRSYSNDSLYWTTFRQYVYQLICKGDLPIEFFIEGTRSRSNKSLSPKYGLLSMVLKAFFLSQVPDVYFVPISINYDRILEESLFAFELLGVPKPKESTSGFFKSMTILKEKFGNIYVHMDQPISAKQYFGDKIDRSVHSLGPLHQQEITESEKKMLPPLAYEILERQQKILVLTVFNLMALVLNNNLSYHQKSPALTVKEVTEEVEWIKNIVDRLGGFTDTQNLEKSVTEALSVHRNLIGLNEKRELRLIRNEINQHEINPKRLKAHALSDKLMTHSVPFVMLQIYSNPVLQYFVDLNVILVILGTGAMKEDQLFENYHFLRSLFAREFVIFSAKDQMVFSTALSKAQHLNLIDASDGNYQLGSNQKLREFVINAFTTFYLSYDAILVILQKLPEVTDEKSILANTQKILESAITQDNVHPYSLNLDTLGNCLSCLCDLNVLKKSRRDNRNMYETDMEKLNLMKENFEEFIHQYVLRVSYQVVQDQIPNKL